MLSKIVTDDSSKAIYVEGIYKSTNYNIIILGNRLYNWDEYYRKYTPGAYNNGTDEYLRNSSFWTEDFDSSVLAIQIMREN